MIEVKVEGSKRSRKFIDAILPSMLQQLNIEKSNAALMINVTSDCEGSGAAFYMEAADCYIVLLKPQVLRGNKLTIGYKELAVSLAHELVHVKQMIKGQLKITNGKAKWMGKVVSKKVKYLDQPWEVEAFSRQELIMRRALED